MSHISHIEKQLYIIELSFIIVSYDRNIQRSVGQSDYWKLIWQKRRRVKRKKCSEKNTSCDNRNLVSQGSPNAPIFARPTVIGRLARFALEAYSVMVCMLGFVNFVYSFHVYTQCLPNLKRSRYFLEENFFPKCSDSKSKILSTSGKSIWYIESSREFTCG